MKQSEALDILKMGHNVFLTGPAGSGKTHLLNTYINFLKRRGVYVGVTASTGIAATHMNGITIHSWSGLGIKNSISEKELTKMLKRSYLKSRIKNTSVLIIDEISMLHAHQLDAVDIICRKFKANNQPFGGMQVVFSGDFFQLPPISRDGKAVQFAHESITWQRARIATCHLDEQHRHDDEKLMGILNDIRQNKVSESTHQQLTSRQGTTVHEAHTPTKLYTHNVDVDRINNKKLDELPGKTQQYQMSVFGPEHLTDSLAKSCLAPQELVLKKNAVVMFVKNNFELGYVNGTLGVVKNFNDDGFPVVKTYAGDQIVVSPEQWSIEEDGIVRAYIIQVPLRLAWAITVHKSQGMSLDAAEVDLSKSFEQGMGYVALSRVRTLDGLNLKGINSTALEVNPDVLEKNKVFRETSERTARRLREIPQDEKKKQHEQFLKRVVPPEKERRKKRDRRRRAKRKESTIEETKRLVEQGFSIKTISKERGLVPGTILAHLERLKERGDMPDITHLKPPKKVFNKIAKAFKKSGEINLSPVRELLGENFSYDDIRLVRLFLDL